MSAFKNSKDQENARLITQCALFDNMWEMSKVYGSPYPGARDGIITDGEPSDLNNAGIMVNPVPIGGPTQSPPTPNAPAANKKQIIKAARCIPKNAVLYQAPPEYTVAHLMRTADVTPFFEATPAQLSSLVPQIFIELLVDGKWKKLQFASKTVSEHIDNRRRLLLTPATEFESDEELFGIMLGAEEGYLAEGGIKRFEFEFDNNMFYERNIKATLELHFKHASDLGLDMYRRLFRLSDGMTESGPSKPKVEGDNFRSRYQEIRDCAVLLKNAGIQGLHYDATTRMPTLMEFNESIRGLSPNFGTILGKTKLARDQMNELLASPLHRVKSTANRSEVTFGVGQATNWVEGWLNDETPASKTSRPKYMKCTMGWADYNADIEGFGKKLHHAVKETQRTFILNMTDYDVDFKEDGQVAVTFNYIASIDAHTRHSPKMDILEHLFQPRQTFAGNPIPKEYDHVLVGVPSKEKIAKLYRPLAEYGVMARRLSSAVVAMPDGFAGTANEFAKKLDESTAVEFEKPQNILDMRRARGVKIREKIMSGGDIESSNFYQYSLADSPNPDNRVIKESSMRHMRQRKVSGGGYLITRLIYQLEDPFGSRKIVFQVQEKGILAEMSLIEKEINYLREEIKGSRNQEKINQLTKYIKQLQEAFSVAKELLVEARTFRKTARSSGFLKSFEENKILRMASLETETFEDVTREDGNFSQTLEEYQKAQPATVKFYPFDLDLGQGEDVDAAWGKNQYLRYFEKVASLQTYDKKSKPNAVLDPGSFHHDKIQGGTTYIPFVQLGHLLSHMMGYRTNYGLIFGTFKMPTADGKKVIYNISDIPITLPMLMTWYFKQVINTGREVYPFRTAMRDIITDLVQPLLTRHCLVTNLEKGESPPSIKFSNLTSLVKTFTTRGDEAAFGASSKDAKAMGMFDPGEVGIGKNEQYEDASFERYLSSHNRMTKFVYTAEQVLKNPVPHYQISKAAPKEIRHYYVIHATCPVQRSADYNRDMKEGIYHLILGRDRGILKRVNFSRKEMPYLESKNIEQASAGNLDAVLTIPMDADVELFGNNYFQHGQMIYINAEFGLSKILAESMKVGGYYMVTKVSNSMDNSGWTTNLKCIWQSQGYSDTRWGGEV